uniref:Uncharacterized protein n=1 Tax=Oryza brachyantha TaxID=4533 RepID=J3M257_ORYBR
MVRALDGPTAGDGFGFMPTAHAASWWVLVAFAFAAALAVVAIAVFGCADGPEDRRRKKKDEKKRRREGGDGGGDDGGDAGGAQTHTAAGITTMDMAETTAAGTTITTDMAETTVEAGTTMVVETMDYPVLLVYSNPMNMTLRDRVRKRREEEEDDDMMLFIFPALSPVGSDRATLPLYEQDISYYEDRL